jgi:hypothetical protein
MSKYESRLKALQKHIPREPFDFELWFDNEDGTLTGPGGRTLTREEYARECEGEFCLTIGDAEGNAEAFRKWKAGEW